MKTYRIRNWEENFESGRTNQIKRKSQANIPLKQGLGLKRMIGHDPVKGPAMYGCFVAVICMLSARTRHVRNGYMTETGEEHGPPMSVHDIALVIGMDPVLVADTFNFCMSLSDPWIEVYESAYTPCTRHVPERTGSDFRRVQECSVIVEEGGAIDNRDQGGQPPAPAALPPEKSDKRMVQVVFDYDALPEEADLGVLMDAVRGCRDEFARIPEPPIMSAFRETSDRKVLTTAVKEFCLNCMVMESTPENPRGMLIGYIRKVEQRAGNDGGASNTPAWAVRKNLREKINAMEERKRQLQFRSFQYPENRERYPEDWSEWQRIKTELPKLSKELAALPVE